MGFYGTILVSYDVASYIWTPSADILEVLSHNLLNLKASRPLADQLCQVPS